GDAVAVGVVCVGFVADAGGGVVGTGQLAALVVGVSRRAVTVGAAGDPAGVVVGEVLEVERRAGGIGVRQAGQAPGGVVGIGRGRHELRGTEVGIARDR